MKKNIGYTLLGIGLVIILAAVPLFINRESEFGGSDDKAENLIGELDANYEPWAAPIWEPPGGETESLLFALQAALGAGVIGYGLGYLKGRGKTKPDGKAVGKDGKHAKAAAKP